MPEVTEKSAIVAFLDDNLAFSEDKVVLVFFGANNIFSRLVQLGIVKDSQILLWSIISDQTLVEPGF